jgi:hypothetical protein
MDFPENTGLLIKALRFSTEKHRYQRAVSRVDGLKKFNFVSEGREI